MNQKIAISVLAQHGGAMSAKDITNAAHVSGHHATLSILRLLHKKGVVYQPRPGLWDLTSRRAQQGAV